jgi:hypothetical protein
MIPATPVLLKPIVKPREIVYAKDQPEYVPLPALVSDDDGVVTTRWSLTWRERIVLLFGGNLYLQVLTFHRRLQPVKLMVDEPEMNDCL